MRKFTLIAAALLSLVTMPAMANKDGLYIPTLHVLADALLLVDMSVTHPTTYTYVRVPIAGTSQGVSTIECRMRMNALSDEINGAFKMYGSKKVQIPIDKNNGILFATEKYGYFAITLRERNQPRITCEPKV